ncbi:hypothetical protein E2C01_012833 [Portunus trituberculatus]|uniref:Uncharacterized protein n=1 Tax=Portunus trituberculatus TaxID=210409 RepID=A0A5B7DEQ6_PORTR|nr:hypothetical protein [Portunus trituberculatus]
MANTSCEKDRKGSAATLPLSVPAISLGLAGISSVPSQSLAEVDTFALGFWHRVETRVARLFCVLNSLGLGVVPSLLSSWFAAVTVSKELLQLSQCLFTLYTVDDLHAHFS